MRVAVLTLAILAQAGVTAPVGADDGRTASSQRVYSARSGDLSLTPHERLANLDTFAGADTWEDALISGSHGSN